MNSNFINYAMKRERSPDTCSNSSVDSSVAQKRSRHFNRDASRGSSVSSEHGHQSRVYVSNIPFNLSWRDIRNVFNKEVGEVAYVQMHADEHDNPRGCATVMFAQADSAPRAILKMNQFDLLGRNIVVRKETRAERELARVPRHFSLDESNERAEPAQWGDTFGISVELLEKLNVQPPLVNTLHVANVAYSVDRRKLKQVFRLAGRVVSCEIHANSDGTSRGVAVVEYEHPVEAVQAISMLNGQLLYDRALVVRLDPSQRPRSSLPAGLAAVGPGLGLNGLPLTDITKNVLGDSDSSAPPANTALVNLTAASARHAGGVNTHLAARARMQPAPRPPRAAPCHPRTAGNSSCVSPLEWTRTSNGQEDAVTAAHDAPRTNHNGPQNVLKGHHNGPQNVLKVHHNGPQNVQGSHHNGPQNVLKAYHNGPQTVQGSHHNGPQNTTNVRPNGGHEVSDAWPLAVNGRRTGAQTRGTGAQTRATGAQGESQPSMTDSRAQEQPLATSDGGLASTFDDESCGPTSSPCLREIPNDTILVKNIPVGTTSAMLGEWFSHVGEMTYAEMKAKDAGIVRFINSWDGNRAVRMMNRKVVGRKALEVCLFD